MIVARHNIFELMGKGQNVYHSAIFTCYSFDPIFFESFFIPKMRLCGVGNVVVVLDAGNYDKLLEEYPNFGLSSEHHRYTIVRRESPFGGVFHPKISLLIGRNAGLLVVGSGNLTYGGLSLNDEIWSVFSLRDENSVYRSLLVKAWEYLFSLKDEKSLLTAMQFDWMFSHSDWLQNVKESVVSEPVRVGDESFWFITNGNGQNILGEIEKIIAGKKVCSIDVVSPFYDENGRLLDLLYSTFEPKVIRCVISRTGTFPYDRIMRSESNLLFYDWEDVFIKDRGAMHNLHAKIFQFQTETRSMLVCGSANATYAAMTGRNEESCIVAVSDSSKDYLKESGIIFNKNIDVSTLTDSNRIRGSKAPQEFPRSLKISSSEIIDSSLRVYVQGKDATCILLLLDISGRELVRCPVSLVNGVIKTDVSSHAAAIAVLVNDAGQEVSNRCFIYKDEYVERFNPDKNLRKLESLLDSALNRKEDIWPLLSFVYFDDRSSEKLVVGRYVKKESERDRTSKLIQKEKFDDIRIGNRSTVLSIPDVRIVDFLLSSMSVDDKAEGGSEISDDIESSINIDDGNNEYQVRSNYRAKVTFSDCVDRYTKNLANYYNKSLAGLYETARKHGNDIFKSSGLCVTREAHVVDFSHVLIDVALMWHEMLYSGKKLTSSVKTAFLTNVGKFLILFWKTAPVRSDYAWHKMEEFHRELTVFSLLIIAVHKWYGQEGMFAKLLVLNLLDSYRDSETFDVKSLYTLFTVKLHEVGINPYENSLNMINVAFTAYESFHRNRRNNATLREISATLDGEYVYKNNYGFMYATDIVRSKDIAGNMCASYSLHHPAFDEDISFVGGVKIRTLPE